MKIEYPTWLVPIDNTLKKRDTKWICVCNLCQNERTISYAQAFNIVKGHNRRECIGCQTEFNMFQKNTSGLELGRSKENQIKSANARIGTIRTDTTKYLEYNWLLNSGLFITEAGREKQRLSKLGKRKEDTNNWKGGRTSERKLLTSQDIYKQLRKEVFSRDNFTCLLCNTLGGKLEMHHIKEWSNYPELRYEKDNCQTLCKECHIQTDNYGTKAKKVSNFNGL